MNVLDMILFTAYMANEFKKEFTRVCGPPEDDFLENGYCFYFARLLNTLIPGSQMVVIHQPFDHYLLFYDGQFYDHRGIKGKIDEGIVINETLIPFDNLIFATDSVKESDLVDTLGMADQTKNEEYEAIQDALMASGRNYLAEHHLLEPEMKR